MADLCKKNKRIITTIIIVSIFFIIAVALDITPFLRGPVPYPPEWQWAYYFVNTLDKIWVPLLVFLILIFLVYKIESNTEIFIRKNEKKILGLAILLSFLLQISILFFGRSGAGILLQRVIDPGMSGYFTIATQIKNPNEFLSNYHNNVLKYPGHARGHPPGLILSYFALDKLFSKINPLSNIVDSFLPSNDSVKKIWNNLPNSQKATGMLSGFLISFVSGLALVPLYYLAKYLSNTKTATRTLFLYIFVPSFVLFIPMIDVIMPVFSISSIYLFINGLKSFDKLKLFFSGFILSLGVFFSLSLIPILLFLLLYLIFESFKNEKKIFSNIILNTISILSGFLFFQLMLFVLFGYNFVETYKNIMSGLAPRSYIIWLFYNIYDFFIFAGIPILILSVLILKNLILDILRKQYKRLDLFTASFFVMLLMLDISGASRAETGRIWLPIMPILILITSIFITHKLKLNKYMFLTVIILQFTQILIMQEFWVMLW